MSSILNTAMSGINSMKVMIDNTIDRMTNAGNKKIEKHIFLENIAEGSKSNTAVKVKEIYDNYNDFITEEKRKTNSQVKNEQTKLEQLLKLEDLLCNKSNIFNELIDDLYKQIKQDIVLDKQNIINEDIKKKFSTIVSSLKDFGKKLNFLEQDIKESVINHVRKVNLLIDKIHDITIDINCFPILRIPNTIDSFIDKRDNLVDELNDLIRIKVVKNHDSYKVCLDNGLCIIDNHKKQNLMPLTSISDPGYIDIGYTDNDSGEVKEIDDKIPNSAIGALLRFRREELNDAKNKIGQLTVNFTDSMNAYHVLGYDMFGHLGKQIFNISNPETVSNITNQSSFTAFSKWISPNDAKDTDYIIYFKNNNWNITRLSDHTTVQPNIRQDNNNIFITFDGIEFNKPVDQADGDIYMIKPYSQTLEKLELLIDQNTPFAFSSIDDINYNNRNNAITINQLNKDLLVNNADTLDEAYQKFSKSIAYKCNALEEELPFKEKMIEILHDKKISMSNDLDQDYQDLNYQQDCYLANVKVLEVAENIFNEIVDCYS